MANIKYFADRDGQTFELTSVFHDGSNSSAARHYSGRAEDGTRMQATRMVEYKRWGSRHECDSRCIHAKGRTMKCECSCGGRNHGKGA